MKSDHYQKYFNLTLYRIIRKMGVPCDVVRWPATNAFDYGFDNFDMTIFLFYLESFFNIEITHNEIPELQTIGQTINFHEQKLRVA